MISNDYQGNYSLIDNVVIGEVDVKKLVAIGNATITASALKLEQLLRSHRRGRV